MNKLIVSLSPHVHGGDSVKKNMYGVLIALIPAFLVSLYFFGLGALIVTLTSVAACLFFEWAIGKFLLKKETTSICDGSAIITGVLLAFNLPSNLPIWIIILGALFAIGVGKMSFGGVGCNPLNPALAGRVFLLLSFPVQMTTWPAVENQLVEPQPVVVETADWGADDVSGATASADTVDAFSGATPLALMKIVTNGTSQVEVSRRRIAELTDQVSQPEADTAKINKQIEQTTLEMKKAEKNVKEAQAHVPSWIELLIGQNGGSLGEVSAIALLLGFAYMLWKKIISWHIPIAVIGTVFVFAGILHLFNPQGYASPEIHLLTGGLMLGAIFMATDYVTSPMSHKGMLIYGVCIGLLTVVIRTFGAYPEGMSFAILIMNAFTPLINTYVKPKRFGEVAKKKMKKLESSLKNMLLVLTGVTAISVALLAYVNVLTKEPIAQANAAILNEALKEVLPPFTEVKTDTVFSEKNGKKTVDFIVYPASAEGKLIGIAVQAMSLGFGGELKVLVGFDLKGNIINYSLLSHAETPGLGSKAADWFKKGNKGDITGKNPGIKPLVVRKDGGDVDAITASTITSRAFLKAINEAYEIYYAGRGAADADALENVEPADSEAGEAATDSISAK